MSQGVAGILLVDDDAEVVRNAADALTKEGFAVALAQSGAGALHHLNDGFRSAVLVTGVRMRGIGGLELADAVRDVSPATSVVFIAESAAVAGALSRRSAAPVLVKPVDPVDLVWHVRASVPEVIADSVSLDAELDGYVELSVGGTRPRLWPWIIAALLIASAWLVTESLARGPAPFDKPRPTPADVLPSQAPSGRAISSDHLLVAASLTTERQLE